MTKHTRTAPPVQPVPMRGGDSPLTFDLPATRKAQRQADAKLDEAAPLRYVPSMGKNMRATSQWSKEQQKAAHDALIAWNKP